MKLIRNMECPYCNGTASLKKEMGKFNVKGELIKLKEYFYRCNLCNKEFTTTESDTVSFGDIFVSGVKKR